MTVEEALELGRAGPKGEGRPGQIFIATRTTGGGVEEGCVVLAEHLALFGGRRPVNDRWKPVPDLRDPGTLGHALDQVLSLYKSNDFSVFHWPSGRVVLSLWVPNGLTPARRDFEGRSKAGALLAARRAAP